MNTEIKEYHLENYIIYSNGEVYSKRKNRMLSKTKNNCGYVQYCIDGKWMKAHRLVALYFIPNPNFKEEINHIDMNKENNDISNLEWVSHSENHKLAHSIKKWGGSKPGFKLSEETKQEMSKSAHDRWGKVRYGDIIYDSCKDAAEQLNVNVKTISRWISSGKMARIK